MKRHLLRAMLAALLALSCVASFAACENQNSDTNDTTSTDTASAATDSAETDAPIVTTVSADEWKKAFDFSKLDSFTVTYTARNNHYKTVGADPEIIVPVPNPDVNTEVATEATPAPVASPVTTVTVINVAGTVKYEKGHILTDLSKKVNDEAFPAVTVYSDLALQSLLDVDLLVERNYDKEYVFGMGRVIDHLMASADDYGYSIFNYSEEKQCYINDTPFEEEVVHTEVYIENGMVKRISSGHEESFIDMTISAANATECAAPLTDEALSAALSAAEGKLASASSTKLVGMFEMPILGLRPMKNDVELSVVVDAFKAATAKSVLSMTVAEGKLIAVSFDAKGSQLEIGKLLDPIPYDAVTVSFDENGNAVSINFTEDFYYEIAY